MSTADNDLPGAIPSPDCHGSPAPVVSSLKLVPRQASESGEVSLPRLRLGVFLRISPSQKEGHHYTIELPGLCGWDTWEASFSRMEIFHSTITLFLVAGGR